jgi:caffeoyl-CoA O-methyltransferase
MTTFADRWIPGRADREWIESLSEPPHPVLFEMERLADRAGVPILDRASSRVLAVLATDRRRIVEVGTAIGYSTLWMALAQPADGHIVTIDPDPVRTNRAREYWRRAGVADEQIVQVEARALDAFGAGDPRLAGPFDLAFIDALKPEYPAYLEALAPRLATGALLPRLAPGALVVADNVLWGGRSADDRPAHDPDTAALRALCTAVLADPRFRATILPVGDGLLVAVLVAPAEPA